MGAFAEGYHQLRERRDTQAALADRRLDLAPLAITREVLREAMKVLSNSGAGAVGADEAVVAGQGGTAIRADTIAQVVIQHLVAQSGAAPAEAGLHQKYLAYLGRECQRLPVAALGGKTESRPLALKDVHVDLNTTRHLPRRTLAKIQSRELHSLPTVEESETPGADEVPRRVRPGEEVALLPDRTHHCLLEPRSSECFSLEYRGALSTLACSRMDLNHLSPYFDTNLASQ